MTYSPLFTLMDSTWLLYPSPCRLRTSPVKFSSFPPNLSRPCKEIEGKEKYCKKEKKIQTSLMNSHLPKKTYRKLLSC